MYSPNNEKPCQFETACVNRFADGTMSTQQLLESIAVLGKAVGDAPANHRSMRCELDDFMAETREIINVDDSSVGRVGELDPHRDCYAVERVKRGLCRLCPGKYHRPPAATCSLPPIPSVIWVERYPRAASRYWKLFRR